MKVADFFERIPETERLLRLAMPDMDPARLSFVAMVLVMGDLPQEICHPYDPRKGLSK